MMTMTIMIINLCYIWPNILPPLAKQLLDFMLCLAVFFSPAQHGILIPAELVRVARIFSYTKYLSLASPNTCHVSEN